MRPVLALLALVIIVGAAMILPVRPYLDFQVIYHANLGLLRGIPLYDHPGQVQMISELAGVPSSQVYVLPFPYPPWYALGTLWLAAMPIALAARAWFAGNLVMLLLSGLLLAHKLSSRRSAAAVLGIVLWLPALGSLLVGQYGVPVLLGAALMIHGLREEKAPLVAVAGALLTFKPHLGGLAILLTLVSLVRRRDAFGRRSLLAIAAVGMLLLGFGFVASPNWPVEYMRSLERFGSVRGVPDCTQCVSLAVTLSRFFGGGLGVAAWISAGVAVLCLLWVASKWEWISAQPARMIAAGVLVTLIASSYLLNYDYVLLIVPMLGLAIQAVSHRLRIVMALAYVLPWIGLVLIGPAGNVSLVGSAFLVGIAFYAAHRPPREVAAVSTIS